MVAGYGDEDLYFRSTSYMFVVLCAQGKNGIRVSCMNSHNSCSSIGHTYAPINVLPQVLPHGQGVGI